MMPTTLFLAASLLGVDAGWQPISDHEMEYIIQIEPELLETLKAGKPLTSEIPAHLYGVRRYRIVVGRESLPRIEQAPDRREGTDAVTHTGPTPVELSPGELGGNPSPPTVTSRAGQLSPPHSYSVDPGVPSPIERASHESAEEDRMRLVTEPAPAKPKQDVPQNGKTRLVSQTATRPWLPLVLCLVSLCLSIGGNLYLGWITWDTRHRYQRLVRENCQRQIDQSPF